MFGGYVTLVMLCGNVCCHPVMGAVLSSQTATWLPMDVSSALTCFIHVSLQRRRLLDDGYWRLGRGSLQLHKNQTFMAQARQLINLLSARRLFVQDFQSCTCKPTAIVCFRNGMSVYRRDWGTTTCHSDFWVQARFLVCLPEAESHALHRSSAINLLPTASSTLYIAVPLSPHHTRHLGALCGWGDRVGTAPGAPPVLLLNRCAVERSSNLTRTPLPGAMRLVLEKRGKEVRAAAHLKASLDWIGEPTHPPTSTSLPAHPRFLNYQNLAVFVLQLHETPTRLPSSDSSGMMLSIALISE
jgi:hypothetical protein